MAGTQTEVTTWPHLAEGLYSFLRASQLFHTSNLSVLRLLAEQLSQNGLTLTIVSKGNTLGAIGHEVKGGMASSLLGVPHLEIRGAGLLARITG